MAGRGPAPKDASQLAGHGAAKAREGQIKKYLRSSDVEQPKLPTFYVFDAEGNRRKFVWPEATKRWWGTWGDEPMSQDFTATDWDFLLDTALLHARLWREGDVKVMPELRLRVAKLGATVEDRQRLRIDYVPVVDGDGPQAPQGGSRARRGPLTSVG